MTLVPSKPNREWWTKINKTPTSPNNKCRLATPYPTNGDSHTIANSKPSLKTSESRKQINNNGNKQTSSKSNNSHKINNNKNSTTKTDQSKTNNQVQTHILSETDRNSILQCIRTSLSKITYRNHQR
jgi:hypothetical protein